jgi:DNA-binding MarR family transcriptional regulator
MNKASSTTNCGYLIKQISEGIGKQANNQLRRQGLTLMQANILSFLYVRKAAVPLKEIEAQFRIAQSTVSGLCHRMAEKGLIELQADPANKSAKTARLTAKGEQLNHDAEQETAKMEQRLMQGIGEQDARQLQAVLWKMLGNLNR